MKKKKGVGFRQLKQIEITFRYLDKGNGKIYT